MRRSPNVGDKPGTIPGLPSYAVAYPPGGPYTFTAPRNGKYLFIANGPGGGANGTTVSGTTGASGAYSEKLIWLNSGQTVSITVGGCQGGVGALSTVENTTIGAPVSVT